MEVKISNFESFVKRRKKTFDIAKRLNLTEATIQIIKRKEKQILLTLINIEEIKKIL